MLEGKKRVHFVGIGGYGMSALALILLQSGFDVRGSDLKKSGLTEMLSRAGAQVYTGHKKEQLADAEIVVYSTAIPEDNPEMEAARKKNLPLWHRSQLLAAILNAGYGIAIAGAHGKTTTTAMVSLLLQKAGLEPTAVIGGEVPFFEGNARLGKSEYIVAEACESDNSFLRYHPTLALVTNVEPDHLEYYGGSFPRLVETYRDFVNNVKDGGRAIFCIDDPVLQKLKERVKPGVVTYGFGEKAMLRGTSVQLEGLTSRFQVNSQGTPLGEIVLKVPGIHNVQNALGATAAALALNVPFNLISLAFLDFKGARRRFELVGEKNGVMIVDDYAHHPTEVKATLQAAKQSNRRVICVFQPHRYTRTSFLWDEFTEAFHDADFLLLTEIYSAGEKPIPGITSKALAEDIKKKGNHRLKVIAGQEEGLHYLLQNIGEKDMVLTMGAGDIWQLGRELCRQLPIKGEGVEKVISIKS